MFSNYLERSWDGEKKTPESQEGGRQRFPGINAESFSGRLFELSLVASHPQGFGLLVRGEAWG